MATFAASVNALDAGLRGLDEHTRASEWISWYVRQLDDLRGAGV